MQVDLKDCYIKIGSVEVKIGEGNFTWTEHHARKYIKDRGRLDTVRDDDEQPMDVSFQFTWEWATGDIIETLRGRSGQTSSSDDACEPPSVDISLEYTPECTGTGESGGTYTFPDFRSEELQFDPKAGTVSCTGKCNALQPTGGTGT